MRSLARIDWSFLVLVALLLSVAGCEDSAVEQLAGSTTATVGKASRSAVIYAKHCIACHNSGIGGAPVLGDSSAWASRVAQGLETVYENAINGIRGMPLMGTCTACSEEDIRATVDFMLENSQ